MGDMVQLVKRGRVGLIEIDNPPVNALGQGVRAGLLAAVQQLGQDPDLVAGVVVCKGRTFIAGADIREFGKAHAAPGLPAVMDAIESSSKPIVAAIHGTAFGGGLEIALVCHYRVAVPTAQCGLPEVKLGLLPGAGGTQRLPRLIGVRPALDMITTGEPISAARAKELGLLDEIIEGDAASGALAAGAVAFAERVAGKPLRKVSELEDKLEQARTEPGLFDEYRVLLKKSRRGFEAPQRCVDAVEAAVTLPFAEGSRRERQLFEQLREGDQSKAQRHVFFAEREAAKIPDVPDTTETTSVEVIGIIGAGTMGSGIAIACANAGLAAILMDREQAYVDKGLAAVAANYGEQVKRGRMSQAEGDKRIARVRGTTQYGDLAGVDVVIEAVFEEMPIKKEVFSALDKVCKKGAILATNTSTLDVNEIASATKRPEDVIGLHFFSPANIMKLLEIVRGEKTSKSVIATSMKLGKTLKKLSVLVGVCHGFVGNRMLYPYRREALFMVEEGALPQQVDKALTDFGLAMGPFAVSDLAGLDIGWRVRKAQGKPQGERYSGTIADRLCEAGHYGQKTGQGFYQYPGGSRTPQPYAELEQLVMRTSEELGIKRRKISDEEIVERCIYAMINEGCKILEEGIALRSSDIDLVWLNGYGFPAYRGGPMFYGDKIVGLRKVHDAVQRLREEHGKLWEPPALLTRLAQEGAGFPGG